MKGAYSKGPEQKSAQGTVSIFESDLLRYRILNKGRPQEMVPHNIEKVKRRSMLSKVELLWQMVEKNLKVSGNCVFLNKYIC